ncbi:MAG: hypothetical protein OXC60_07370 [Litoreibacter sp.]|nr:hypothetical protein [Litoreibacter sp.]MCY4334480.1 hypothetical protein [Litoreibacter sp.]
MLDLFIAPWGVSSVKMFGFLAGVLSLGCFIPYVIDTLRRQTQPDRASWLIWSVLGSISFFSNIYEGATSSLWFVGVQVGSTIGICVLSIWLGAGQYLSRKNKIVFGIASLGLVAWYFTETAVYALAISIAISLIGGLVTVEKAYRNPDSETLVTWVMGLVAAGFAALSVGQLDLVLLAYPFYLITLYAAIVCAVMLGRLRGKTEQAEAQLYSDAFERTAVFLSPAAAEAGGFLAPESHIFDELDELAAQKNMQVPPIDQHVQ